jgi:hypothetical protein
MLGSSAIGRRSRAERVELARQITRHVTENLVLLPMLHDSWPGVTGGRPVNAGAAGGDAAWNAHEWDVRK